MNDESKLKQLLYESGILPVLDPHLNLPIAQIVSALTQGGISAIVLEHRDQLLEEIAEIKRIRPDLLIGVFVRDAASIPIHKNVDCYFTKACHADPHGAMASIIPICSSTAEAEACAAKGAATVVFDNPVPLCTLRELYGRFPQVSVLLEAEAAEAYLKEPNVLAVFSRTILAQTPDAAPGEITKRANTAMNQAYNITTGHLGINMENREQAAALADTLSALFGKPWRETAKSFLVGDLVEIMKMIYLGKNGHIGILTNDLRRSIRFYQTKGAAFNMATYEENAIVYFAQEYGGVAFHLTQRPKERGNEVL